MGCISSVDQQHFGDRATMTKQWGFGLTTNGMQPPKPTSKRSPASKSAISASPRKRASSEYLGTLRSLPNATSLPSVHSGADPTTDSATISSQSTRFALSTLLASLT
ncbi:hypothetical protein K239x_33560 [Planctomycetes bacterium K23_9]|uniref:Uncharacterized protein n=1 Tax=Stieleria marina TaxID=1930275 RepID=A0A517NW59_9BACT|nr:hypothetical protein K239x_33560 [Planctomycetes bacterium K23_9]